MANESPNVSMAHRSISEAGKDSNSVKFHRSADPGVRLIIQTIPHTAPRGRIMLNNTRGDRKSEDPSLGTPLFSVQSHDRDAGEVTQLLARWSAGDRAALDLLTSVVYAELRKIADGYLRRERRDHTLQPTALVHEAWM